MNKAETRLHSIKRNALPAALLLAGAAAWSAAPAWAGAPAGADWPQWRGPERNGVSRETGWSSAWGAGGPKRLWRAAVGRGSSALSVSRGRVYTMGNAANTDTVWCLDAKSGRQIWKHAYPCPLDPKYYFGGPNATPVVDGQAVYTLSKKGHLFCLDAASGKVIWQRNIAADPGFKPPSWGFAGSPLVLGKRLILNAGEAGLALDKTSGKVIWKSANGPSGYASPLPYPNGAAPGVAIFARNGLLGLDPRNGRVLFKHRWKTSYGVNAADPVLIGKNIFISSGYGKGCALLQLGGAQPKLLWQNKNMRTQGNGCVLWKGYIYGVDAQLNGRPGSLKCLDPKSGAVRWARRGFQGQLTVAGGKLLIGTVQGELVVAEADPARYRELARTKVFGGTCYTAPVLSHGLIYCRNGKPGELVCLDVRGK